MAEILIRNICDDEVKLVGDPKYLCSVGNELLNALYEAYNNERDRGHFGTASATWQIITDIDNQLDVIKHEINYLGCNED